MRRRFLTNFYGCCCSSSRDDVFPPTFRPGRSSRHCRTVWYDHAVSFAGAVDGDGYVALAQHRVVVVDHAGGDLCAPTGRIFGVSDRVVGPDAFPLGAEYLFDALGADAG